MTRKERRRRRARARRIRMVVAAATLATMVMCASFVLGKEWTCTAAEVQANEPKPVQSTPVLLVNTERTVKERQQETVDVEDPEELEPPEDFENEKIEEALVDQGYFVPEVPLSFDEQDFLHTACTESGVPYALALAVIERETQFQNLVGDDGASLGYMQVQERWHWDRMERLGVSDLMDPFGNFRVGCDFLAELLEKYPVQEALTAYNSGSPGYNQYSYDVMENYEKWKELVGDEVSGIKG